MRKPSRDRSIKRMKGHNRFAHSLEDPFFRHKRISSQKLYTRKIKHPGRLDRGAEHVESEKDLPK